LFHFQQVGQMTNCIRVPAFSEGTQRELLILHIIQLVIINVFGVEQRERTGLKATKSYSCFYPALCTNTGLNYHHINPRIYICVYAPICGIFRRARNVPVVIISCTRIQLKNSKSSYNIK
jgi:hypothetical protein